MVQDIIIFFLTPFINGNLYAHYICFTSIELMKFAKMLSDIVNMCHCELYNRIVISLGEKTPIEKRLISKTFFLLKIPKIMFWKQCRLKSLYYTETSNAYFPFLNRLLSCPSMLHLCEA